MGKHIELIARGLCVERGALLVCVDEEHGYGYLPGGHVEFGESAKSALVRELAEECGVEVTCPPPVLGLEISFSQNGRRRHEVSLVFPVKRANDRAVISSLEPEVRFEWWPVESLLNRDLRPMVLRDWIVSTAHVLNGAPTTMEWVSAMNESHNP